MTKAAKASASQLPSLRRSGRLAGESLPPEDAARSLPTRARKADARASPSVATDGSRLSSLTPSGDELPAGQGASAAVTPRAAVTSPTGAPMAGVRSPIGWGLEGWGEDGAGKEEDRLRDERRAFVFISVHTVDKSGKVVAESAEEYPLSTHSYSVSGGSNRVIDICPHIPHLFNSNSPLRNRTGRLKIAPRGGGRYRALGSLDKLIAGTAVLEFASMGYLPISDADEDGHHHAELFLEELPATVAPARLRHAKAADEHVLPLAMSKAFAPAVTGKTVIKIEPVSVVDLTADSGEESDTSGALMLVPKLRATSSQTPSIEIVPFFQVHWAVEVATGKADRMSQVRERIWPVVERVNKLKRTMTMKNRGGFEIPISNKYPLDLQGRTLTQADLGRIYYGKSDTKFQEEFGMFITNVDRYPHVKAWLYEPFTAQYAAIFNHMKPVDFKEAFNANWPVWKKKRDEWMNAYEYAARRAEGQDAPAERASATAPSSPSTGTSSDDESGKSSSEHRPPSAPVRKKRRISPTPEEDDDDEGYQRVRTYKQRGGQARQGTTKDRRV